LELQELNGPVVLDIPADPAALFLVRALVGKLSERIGFSREDVDKLILAIDEACTNIIRHAYKDCEKIERIILTFSVNLEYFEVDIRDFGCAADPTCFLSRNLDDVRPGGLGIHFIKSAVDKVEYVASPNGGMLLKLIKFRPQEEIGQN
jgi:anti-sigma regulatory factor (Ser/Thr protein kinase)